MAEPTATSAGISLTVLSVALFGPMAGPYALIAFAALAGALWPLSASETTTNAAGAWLLLRCTLTAVVLTFFIANIADRMWGFPVNESLAPVALLIGALGNGWRPVFDAFGLALSAILGRFSEGKK
jgi:hypothetical protein